MNTEQKKSVEKLIQLLSKPDIYQSEMKMRTCTFTECERCHPEQSEGSSLVWQEDPSLRSE